jgi:hypothetical protein
MTRSKLQIFTQRGKLVAVTSQEGVLRAKIRRPTESISGNRTTAKL